jgi:hypothetical protein
MTSSRRAAAGTSSWAVMESAVPFEHWIDHAEPAAGIVRPMLE